MRVCMCVCINSAEYETEHGARRRRRENIKIKRTLLCDSGIAYGAAGEKNMPHSTGGIGL